MRKHGRGPTPARLICALTTICITLQCGSAIASEPAVVRQANDSDLMMKEWHSPVTVEIPVVSFLNVPNGKGWEVPGVPKFYCDDVTMNWVELTKPPSTYSNAINLKVRIRLSARKQEDNKSVSVEFRFVEGEDVVDVGRIEDLYIQSNDHTTESESFDLDAGTFSRIFEQGKNPKLKISIVVRTD